MPDVQKKLLINMVLSLKNNDRDTIFNELRIIINNHIIDKVKWNSIKKMLGYILKEILQ